MSCQVCQVCQASCGWTRLSAKTLNAELKLWSSNHQQQHQSRLIEADSQSWPNTTPRVRFHSPQQLRPHRDGAALIMNINKFKFPHGISCQFTFVILHLSITEIMIVLWLCVSFDRKQSYFIFLYYYYYYYYYYLKIFTFWLFSP